jgi:hypothetical protein
MFQDPAKVLAVANLHDQIFANRSFESGGQSYRQEVSGTSDLSHPMVCLFLACNFINVGFGVVVFCYILLCSIDGKIEETPCNHLIFVITALAIWFPCRAYADWYMNLTDTSWISTYAAAWVLAFLLVGASAILALRMVDGTLYHRFALPAAAASAIIVAIAAIKPKLLGQSALAIAAFDPVFLAGFAITAIAILFYISSSIHQTTV